MTVAGGLTLGIPAAAAARTVMPPVAPAGDDTALSPEPVTVENAEEPGENVDASPVVQESGPGTAAQQPVCTGNACNNNGGAWNRNAGGWSYPLAYTYSDTKTINAQPIAAPAGAGRGAGPSVTGVGPAIGPGTGAGAGGAEMAPLQNATQSAEQWPAKGPAEELPGETTDEEGLPGEETDEEESPEKDTTDEAETGEADEADEDEADEADEAPAGVAPEEMAGPAPVAAGGPAGGARLPFTGAPVSVAAAGAGLLAVALGCTLATARRWRSTDAG
ncbi:hypothetical protein [Microbispora triticiradicis]|uniref:Gram-positive cocci surface proteins LPxTG domain-containing protein n=2 Tax=Microbispora TaxID=2005 RepID=A0ABY3M230_9ACTN|nr:MULTISPECIES: hypothetical protein [Microbispora]TLP59785.1 hypothetical protein FED44_16065 [Microbispora fusca]TYB63499.1 hypothetical protein FXF59_09225 [Microbispora tritici]